MAVAVAGLAGAVTPCLRRKNWKINTNNEKNSGKSIPVNIGKSIEPAVHGFPLLTR